MKKSSSRFLATISSVPVPFLTAVLLSFLFVGFVQGAAGVPKIISYQGRLSNASGTLLGGSGTTFYFKFSIWTATSSGSKLWPTGSSCTHSLTVKEGVFNAGVGDTASCADVLDFDFSGRDEVSLEVEVSSDNVTFETLTPRQRINSSAFAIAADTLVGTTTQSRLGTTTPIGTSLLTIEATSSSVIALSIRAASGQSADIIQIQNASGVDVFAITGSGNASTSQITVSNGFFQGDFTSCSDESQTVLYNATTGKFSCGSDAGAAVAATLQTAYNDSATPAVIAFTSGKDIVFNFEDLAADPSFFLNFKNPNSLFALQSASTTIISFNRDATVAYSKVATTTLLNDAPNAFAIATSTASTQPIFSISTSSTTPSGAGAVGIATSSPSSLAVISVGGDAYITGGLGVGRATTTDGALETTGQALIGGVLRVSGTGTSTVAGNLDAAGDIEADQIFTSGTGTSTFAGGIQSTLLNITSASATSSFANGIKITSGCFQLADGSCAGTGGGTPGGTDSQVQYNNGGTFGGATNLVYDDTNNRVGIGTTTPLDLLNVYGGNVTFQTTVNSANAFRILNAATSSVFTVSTANGNVTLTGVLDAQSTTATSTFSGGLVVDTNTLAVLFGSNRVGIGTLTPSQALEVSGLINITGAGTSTFTNNIDAAGDIEADQFFGSGTGTSTLSGGLSLSGGNLNIPSGSAYLIANARILDSTTLGSSVITSSLQSVGALNAGSITSGFGAIDVGADAITTTGLGTFGNLLVNGSSTLQNFTFVNATGTQATTTNLAVTNFATTSALRVSNAATFNGNVTLSTLTSGSVVFAGSGGLLSQNNANFFWDDANARLGLGTTSPAAQLSNTGSTYLGDASGDTITIHSGVVNFPITATTTVVNALPNAWSISTSTSITPILSIHTFTGTGVASSTSAGRVGIGTTSPEARLSIDGRTAATDGIAGIHEILTIAPSGGGTQFGNRFIILNSPTGSSNTLGGQLVRIIDDSGLANTVQGIAVQAERGTTTAGTNTGIQATGKTFGIQGITTGAAAGVNIPAGVYAETQSPDQGQALRVYTSTTTSADLVWFFQEGSQTFSGNGLLMNFAKGSGSFTGNFLNLQKTDATQFLVDNTGATAIGTSTLAGAKLAVYGGTVTFQTPANSATAFRILNAATSTVLVADTVNSRLGVATATPAYTVGITGTLGVTGQARFEVAPVILGITTPCNGTNALATNASGVVICDTDDTGGGGGSGGGWTSVDADQLVRLSTTTFRVGIGTTSPYAKLSVDSGAAATTTFALQPVSAQTANIIDIYNTSGVLTSVYTAGGLFGIGSSSPAQELSVGGDIYLTGGLGVGIATTTAGVLETTGQALLGGVLRVSNTGTSTFAGGVQANLLNITSTAATSTFSNGIRLSGGCFELASGSCAGTGGGTPGGTDGQVQYNNGGAFGGASNLFYDDTNNRVGIGTTTPLDLLNVYGGNVTFQTTVNSANAFRILNAATSSVFTVSTATGNVTATGDLTISGTGTSTFSGNVDAAGDIEADQLFTSNTAATSTLAAGLTVDTNTLAVLFGPNRVGIGTLTPSQALEVSGLINITGAGTSTFTNNLDAAGDIEADQFFASGTTATSTFGGISTNLGVRITNGLEVAGGDVILPAGTIQSTEIQNNTIDFVDISDTPSLDANTTIAFGAQNLTLNLDSTGDFLLQDNATTRVLFNDLGQFAIGTTSPPATSQTTLEATSTASVPLTIRGFSGQTANLLQVQNAAGTALFTIDSTGALTAGSIATGFGAIDIGTDTLAAGNTTLTGTLTVTGLSTLQGGYVSQASSTVVGGLTVSGRATTTDILIVQGTATSTFSGNLDAAGDIEADQFFGSGSGTSTFTGGIQANLLNITSTAATSTFANGIRLSAGCFELVSGVCSGDISGSGASGQTAFFTGTRALSGDNDFFWDNTNKRLGLGTTTPRTRLQVAQNTFPQLILTEPGAGADLKHFYASTTAGALTFGTLNDALTTLTERMRLTNAGFLGIGTTSPAAQLANTGSTYLGDASADTVTIHSGVVNFPITATTTVVNNSANVWSISTSTTITPILSIHTGTITVGQVASSTSAGRVGIGTTTPEARLSIDGRTASHIGIAGIHEILTINPTGGGTNFGNRFIINNLPTGSSNSMAGQLIRIIDDSGLANTAIGLEIQAERGTTTVGTNTGLRAVGKTFGVQGITTGAAAGSLVPAAVYAESQATSSDALRVYTSTTSIGTLVHVFQEGTQTFSGIGLKMNFGKGTGPFTGSFLNFQVSDAVRLIASSSGTIGIGTSTPLAVGGGVPSTHRGIHIHSGAQATGTSSPLVLIDTDDAGANNKYFMTMRSDVDGTPVTQFTFNTNGSAFTSAGGGFFGGGADVAEWYPAKNDRAILEPGDLVSVDGSSILSLVKKSAGIPYDRDVIGIVSTKPGLVAGAGGIDDGHGNDALVALVGRVPVNVSDEGGLIKPGDRLTSSSLPGIAMKATTSGMTIGVALEGFDGANYLSEGTIGVLTDRITEESLATTTRKLEKDTRKYRGGAGTEELEVSVAENPDSIEEIIRISSSTAVQPENSAAKEDSTSSGTTVKIGKILVFVNLGWTKLDSAASGLAASPTNAWAVDQSAGKVNVFFYGDLNLNANSILNVASIVSANGTWRIGDDGTLVVEEIQAKRGTFEESLDVGTQGKPSGITIFDAATGEPYCIEIFHGALRSTPGKCSVNPSIQSAPTSETSSSESASSTSTEPAPSTQTSTTTESQPQTTETPSTETATPTPEGVGAPTESVGATTTSVETPSEPPPESGEVATTTITTAQ